ncbi:MAG: hypothetical protein GIW95_06895, partial [Candidatus Eremiobacteraeota bacterium]|nr:hypothetical protein [Candidatus Eremiobacteraeota bacterium]
MTGGLLTLVRKGVGAAAVRHEARRPFRFFLCGDPGLIADLRSLLLRGSDLALTPDAPATLETLDHRQPAFAADDARAIVFLARPGDLAGARLDLLTAMRLPIFALTVDANGSEDHPLAAPLPGAVGEYVVPRIDRDCLRVRFFTHLIESCKGSEVAVGRRLPALRETVALKLTRDAANNALKVAVASAIVDHVPVLGLVLGAVASAGDMVAVT